MSNERLDKAFEAIDTMSNTTDTHRTEADIVAEAVAEKVRGDDLDSKIAALDKEIAALERKRSDLMSADRRGLMMTPEWLQRIYDARDAEIERRREGQG